MVKIERVDHPQSDDKVLNNATEIRHRPEIREGEDFQCLVDICSLKLWFPRRVREICPEK